MAPLSKEMVQEVVEFTCWGRARPMEYKAPHITHLLTSLINLRRFHTKDPD